MKCFKYVYSMQLLHNSREVVLIYCSDKHIDGWFVGEDLFFNAQDWSMHRVVDIW